MDTIQRKAHDGEQNVATVLLIVITIGVGVALFMLAKNSLLPIVQQAGKDLNSYGTESHSWTVSTYTVS